MFLIAWNGVDEDDAGVRLTPVAVGKEIGTTGECDDEPITGSMALFISKASADFESFLITIINDYAASSSNT